MRAQDLDLAGVAHDKDHSTRFRHFKNTNKSVTKLTDTTSSTLYSANQNHHLSVRKKRAKRLKEHTSLRRLITEYTAGRSPGKREEK